MSRIRVPLLFLFVILALGGAAPPERLRIVGANGKTSEDLIPPSVTHTTFESRAMFFVGVDTRFFRLAFDNWAIDSHNGDLVPPTALSIESVAVESDAMGTTRPIMFAGSRSASIAAGSTLISDRLDAASFGLQMFKRGERYWVRMRGSVPAGIGRIPREGSYYGPPGRYASRFDPAVGMNGVSQVDRAGAMTAKIEEDSVSQPMTFTAVLGEPLESGIPSVIGIGTSIADASSDDPTVVSGPAFIARAAFDSDFTKPIPMVNLSRGSSGVAGLASHPWRKKLYFGFADVLIDEHGTGDLMPFGSESVADAQAADKTVWAMARAMGVHTIIKTKIIPRDTSMNGWADAAGQIVNPTFAANADAWNSWLDAEVKARIIDAVVDFSGIRDPRDPQKWLTNGIPGTYTKDGTHPQPAAHIIMSRVLRAKLEQMFPAITH